MNSRRGDELIEQIRAGEDSSGKAANELLNKFNQGYPVQNIKRLTRSSDDDVVKRAAWLVSELGARAVPILDEVDYLLSHPVRNARYYAVDAVLSAASPTHGALIAKAVLLIEDPDPAVRRLAMRLLARASTQQLAAAIPHITDRHVAGLVSWLLNEDGNPATELDIISMLGDPDKVTRIFAAAHAARIAMTNESILDSASESEDEDVRIFAERERDLLKWRR